MSRHKLSVSVLTFALLLSLTPNVALAQRGRRSLTRQIRFEHGHTDITLNSVLRPDAIHVYKFRARAGQRMSVRLRLADKRAGRAGDVVFWVQSKEYVGGRNTTILEGIDPKGGAVNWSGELPLTGEYEIYLSNPEVSDHIVKHPIAYALEVSIK